MNILVNTIEDVHRCIATSTTADYIYMYPPRQCYREFDDCNIDALIKSSLGRSDYLNIYVHFPFCRQICAFCNLYATVARDDSAFEQYVECLQDEVNTYAPMIAGKQINTLYLGGGTPSLFPPKLLGQFLQFLERCIGCSVEEIPEVAIEVSPETVTYESLQGLKDIGINRINLGVQSTVDQELARIGRRYGAEIPLRTLEIAQGIGFNNICVDLIYGLEGQTIDTWRTSVDEISSRGPDTICAYPLTLRPVTSFHSRGYRSLDGYQQYAKYDYVNAQLVAQGYKQETHVRWNKGDRGGYLQKTNHWALENVLGFGAGARSYLWEVDYRNGYSARRRKVALEAYRKQIAEIGHGRVDGYCMDLDERMRKAAILGLIQLDSSWFYELFSVNPEDVFGDVFAMLFDEELLKEEKNGVRLTSLGVKYRDIIVQAIFSKRVRSLLRSFDYRDSIIPATVHLT